MIGRKDKIDELEKRAGGNVKFIDDFISRLEDARETSDLLHEEVLENAARLNEVDKKANRVRKFVDKLLGVTK